MINPGNPLVSMAHVKDGHWNHYRVWKPLSLLVLAGLTPPGWNVSIVDENLGKRECSALPRPDLVGITAFTSQANRAYEVAAHFGRLGVPVVLGGIHATMSPLSCRRNNALDGKAYSTFRRQQADLREWSAGVAPATVPR